MNDFISQYSYLWINYFGLIVIQNTVFLSLVFLLLYVIKNYSAQIKYTICLIAIIKLLVPPLIPLHSSLVASGRYLNLSFVQKMAVSGTTFPATSNAENIAINLINLNWIEILFLVWLLGCVIYLLIAANAILRQILILRQASPLDTNSYTEFIKNGNIRIFRSDLITMPLTLCLFPNRIFVPRAWNDWNEDCRKIVIEHELAHLRRHDSPVQLMQLLVQAIFFFHPLVFILNKKLQLYREMACDDASILNIQGTRIAYSKCLTEIAEKAIRKPLIVHPISTFMRQKSEIFKRIQYQLKEGVMSPVSKRKSVTIIILLILSILPFSLYIDSVTAEPSPTSLLKKNNTIDVIINSAQEIWIDNKKTTLETFSEIIGDIKREDEEQPTVRLTIKEDVAMRVVLSVQLKLSRLNLFKVSYSDASGTRGMNLMLPPPGIESRLEQIPTENILDIYISEHGRVQADDFSVDISELDRFIRENLAKNEMLIISIHADENTQYKNFIAVLDQVKKGNAKRVVINYGNNIK